MGFSVYPAPNTAAQNLPCAPACGGFATPIRNPFILNKRGVEDLPHTAATHLFSINYHTTQGEGYQAVLEPES
jgi:hypothetical protein